MNTTFLEQTNVMSAHRQHFLARWALVMVLDGIGLLAVFIGGIGFAPADNKLGAAYSDLLQAARAPGMYRLLATFDGLGWVLMGGALLLLAVILNHRAPLRALFIAVCGIGMILVVFGGAMRLTSVSDLAARYVVATPDQQTALLQPALALYEIISAQYVVGDFLAGVGWLLVASVGVAVVGFPRWLAGWFALAGVLSLLQGATSALGTFSIVVLLLTVVVGVLGLHVAMALAFWRPRPMLTAGVASAAAMG